MPGSRDIAAHYLFTPKTRGDHRFGDLFLRTRGPWGLAMRQARIAAAKTVRAYPDLQALAREALFPTHPQLESGLARLRRSLGEGRAFESLREYVPGDDVRSIDWKATAKRIRPIARQYEPERSQTVMLLVDCGRHMVSRVGERTKLDFTIDASLRLARASLDRGHQRIPRHQEPRIALKLHPPQRAQGRERGIHAKDGQVGARGARPGGFARAEGCLGRPPAARDNPETARRAAKLRLADMIAAAHPGARSPVSLNPQPRKCPAAPPAARGTCGLP